MRWEIMKASRPLTQQRGLVDIQRFKPSNLTEFLTKFKVEPELKT